MPIQINELVIRAVVEDKGSADAGRIEAHSLDKDTIVAECVDQVLEILSEKRER
jgi:hypothetical protein